jgi:hypothetical protein
LRWFDRERLAVIGDSGQVYLLTDARLDQFKMPAPTSWNVPIEAGQHRSEYPSRVHLTGEPGHVELVTCAGYIQGDDDGCVTWAGAPLTESLVIDDADVIALSADPQEAPNEHEIAAPKGLVVAAKLEGEGGLKARATCTSSGVSKQRSWKGFEPCPFFGASTSWVSAVPPIVAVTLSSSCGEGPDREAVHLLRACSLEELLPPTDDDQGVGETFVYADDLWGHPSAADVAVPGGSYGTWTIRSGERIVGILGSEHSPVLRPDNRIWR